jgi:hypothetical protein
MAAFGTINSTAEFPSSSVGALATVTNVNLKTTGLTTLYTVPAGKTLYIMDVLAEITAHNTVTVDGSFTIGGNDPDYNDWDGGDSFGFNVPVVTGQAFYFSKAQNIATYRAVYPATTVIKFNVATGATATTYTASIHLLGFLK